LSELFNSAPPGKRIPANRQERADRAADGGKTSAQYGSGKNGAVDYIDGANAASFAKIVQATLEQGLM